MKNLIYCEDSIGEGRPDEYLNSIQRVAQVWAASENIY